MDEKLRDDLRQGKPHNFSIVPETSEGRAARTIPAAFLVELVSIPVPIRIAHAVIEGDLHMDQLEVARPFIITDSYFEGKVDFSFAHFSGTVRLNGSIFSDTVSVESTRAARDWSMADAQFLGTAKFNDACIDG